MWFLLIKCSLIPVLAQNLKAGLLISGNISVTLEDPKYLWEPTATHDHGNLVTNLIFFLALQPPLWVVFYSPLAGFSLLAYEVS